MSSVWLGEKKREKEENRKKEGAQLNCEACQFSRRDDGRAIQPNNTEFNATRQRCLTTGSLLMCLHNLFRLVDENTRTDT